MASPTIAKGGRAMTEEEKQQIRELIRAEIAELEQTQTSDNARIDKMLVVTQHLITLLRDNEARVNDLNPVTQNLVALAQNHDAQFDMQNNRIDKLTTLAELHEARMDRFVATVEQYIKGRGSNGTGNS
jgi:uncharacterized coiled-coil DUF342 family protein